MKRITPYLFGAAVVAFAGTAMAAPVTGDYTKITSIDTYSGDTTVFMEKNAVGCEKGVWMRPTQANFKENLNTIEQAAHQNSRVKITAEPNDRWKQVLEPVCRLVKVEMEPVANIGAVRDLDGAPPLEIRQQRTEEERLSIEDQKALEAAKAKDH